MASVIDPRDLEVGHPPFGNGTLRSPIRGGSTMMRITSPHCGRTSTTSKIVTQGGTAKVRCLGCGQVFRVNEQGLQVLDVQPVKNARPRVTPVETASRPAPTSAPAKVEEGDDDEKPSTAWVVAQKALKTTQAIGGGLARMGGAALEWNRALQQEKARKQEEIAKRELERIEAEKAELAKPIPCPFCGEPIARIARKCRHCNEYLDVSLRPGHQQAPQFVINNANTNTVQANATAIVSGGRKRFSPIVVFLLSLLIPVLGQLYTGRLLAGIVWFIVVVIGYAALIVPGIVLQILCATSAGMTDPYN
jgi:hypothetical protein